MNLSIDHVTVASRDLASLSAAYNQAGLSPEYGGTHSNGVTHMAVVGFGDGSYIELISKADTEQESPWWHSPIQENGGPCAWAVGVDDIAAGTARLRDRGISVDGPHSYHRTPEEGARIEWELTFLGDGDPGTMLPFLIEDTTPRTRRISPTDDMATTSITGIETVVLAVPNRTTAVERFKTAFELSTPAKRFDSTREAKIAVFPNAPVILAEPASDGWLTERLNAFGPIPIAYLLGKEPTAATPFDVEHTEEFADRTVSWIGPTTPLDRPYLGIVETDDQSSS
ncbi:VOC family protein [Halomicrococcus sp. NG-SE-24]|uniref:VOC family protein n=1 Tax=Halomicrococcus sp. NG-SE-24 TaxID=3436928 RepID=UPI003D97423B